MNDYLLNLNLIDIASGVFIFGGIFLGYKIAKRTGMSILKIFFGFKQRAFIELTTSREKIYLAILFVWFFFFAFLDMNNIKTVSDIAIALVPGR